jgi:hypothetical protein
MRAVRWALDDWQFSGISQFQSGFPQTLNCQFTYPVNLFAGCDYSRCILTGAVHLSRGDRTFYRFFNTSVIQPSTNTNPGDAAPGVVRGSGVEDWAISLHPQFDQTGAQVNG